MTKAYIFPTAGLLRIFHRYPSISSPTHLRGCQRCEALRFVLLKIVQNIVTLVQVTVGGQLDWGLCRCWALSELILHQKYPSDFNNSLLVYLQIVKISVKPPSTGHSGVY